MRKPKPPWVMPQASWCVQCFAFLFIGCIVIGAMIWNIFSYPFTKHAAPHKGASTPHESSDEH